MFSQDLPDLIMLSILLLKLYNIKQFDCGLVCIVPEEEENKPKNGITLLSY